MVDPLIFGKIIDEYASNPNNLSEEALMKGVSLWLGIAVAVAGASLEEAPRKPRRSHRCGSRGRRLGRSRPRIRRTTGRRANHAVTA